MMQGLKNRTRKALGLRKKDKDKETTSSPDKEGSGSGKKGSKKANGAPNGFYGEIDWDRYASPDVDEEGFSLRPGDEGDAASKEKHFFSSSDSEDDEDSKKKFKIKIKPLVSDSAKCVLPSMDELKASVGGLALSPSLRRSPRRSPGQIKRNLSCEEIARPRRSTPIPSPAPETQSDRLSQNTPAFFELPLERKYARYDVVPTDAWGDSRPRSESQLSRSFPTGAPPPLPPKNIPSRSHYGYPSESAADLPNGRAARSSAPIYLNVLSPASYRGSPAPDLDDVFGPTSEDTMSPRWVTFTDDRPPPPDEPAPPPPPDSPPPDTPSSTPSTPASRLDHLQTNPRLHLRRFPLGLLLLSLRQTRLPPSYSDLLLQMNQPLLYPQNSPPLIPLLGALKRMLLMRRCCSLQSTLPPLPPSALCLLCQRSVDPLVLESRLRWSWGVQGVRGLQKV
ncbi:SH3-containing GRB2-like protein 3-interacting protein 1 isoform X2 [Oreochromis niloticus]|uniref:SH3-containing GRB2-like protein 3-interacting protein 1 isoform X2 n=1 Tax=Oreochromis niloticus TaxID=8128 RepID=UPI000DF34981|nr:SH3-containing GRB2-like protein 3-interacting protein 1 isoform X2 [Oreochromis niloticus]